MHYVIGDIHGQLPAVKELLEKKICFKPNIDHIYFLGDYVDWGCDSIGTLLYIMDLETTYPNVHALLGNHDLMMRETIVDEEAIRQTLYERSQWKRNSGDVTLRDYLKLPDLQQRQIRDWLYERPVEMCVEVYGRKYWLCHGIPLSAVKYLGWKRYAELGEQEKSEDEYIRDSVWYRLRMDDEICGMIPELKDDYVVRGHSITKSRRVEAWDNVLHLDTGAKVFCPLLDDPDWDNSAWKGEYQPSLTAFCLEDESVLCVTMDEFRRMAERDLVRHYTSRDRRKTLE